MNEELTHEEMDAMWSFLYRNQPLWSKYIQTCWSYNKEKASQLTCNTLNKLINQMDSPRTTNENHN